MKYQLQPPWRPFEFEGTSYDLSHLNEYSLTAEDSLGEKRIILVTFSDHCFTRKSEPGDQASLQYQGARQREGVFCFLRYRHSLSLIEHLARAKTGTVWNVAGQNLAVLPTITQDGQPLHYAIVFNLIPLKGRHPYHLYMDVVSAYPCDASKEFVTFGDVGFKKLIGVKMARKQLPKNTGSNRRRPSPPK